MDSDIPSGAAAIGGRIENPLQDEDKQRRAANTRLLRLRQLRFIVVAIMVLLRLLRQPCFIVTVLKIHIGKKEWFPAESDPSVRIPWYLSRRVQRWKEDWTGECMRGKRKALLSCMAALDMAVYCCRAELSASFYYYLCAFAQVVQYFGRCTLSSNHRSFHMSICPGCCFSSGKKEWFCATLQISISIITCKV